MTKTPDLSTASSQALPIWFSPLVDMACSCGSLQQTQLPTPLPPLTNPTRKAPTSLARPLGVAFGGHSMLIPVMNYIAPRLAYSMQAAFSHLPLSCSVAAAVCTFYIVLHHVAAHFGKHRACREVMDSMYRPYNFHKTFFGSYSYVFTLVIPNTIFVYWGFPAEARQYGTSL